MSSISTFSAFCWALRSLAERPESLTPTTLPPPASRPPRLTSPAAIRQILERHGLRTRKSLGQHWLADSHVLERIIDAAELRTDVCTLEIGPGIGVLTRELALRSQAVAAIEYDRMLLPVLEETLQGAGRVRIIQADAARLLQSGVQITSLFDSPESLPYPGVTIGSFSGASRRTSKHEQGGRTLNCVSNLPYGITSAAIIGLLQQKRFIRSIVLLIQSEVADRLVAKPGASAYGALTVFASYHARIERIMDVPASCFYPPPRVESAVVRLRPVTPGTVVVHDSDRLFALSRALFGQRRKTARNALLSLGDRPTRERVAAALETCGIPPESRGEELSVEQIALLADALPATRSSIDTEGVG